MHWYPRFMNDYAHDTEHLSLAENGAYDRFLTYYYQKLKPLPLDETVIFRICRAFTSEEQDAARSVLSQFFTREPDGWHQKRADVEVAKLKQKSQTNSKNARVRHGRTEEANSEGRAEEEKAEGERSKSGDSTRTHSERTCDGNANAPANAERTDMRSHTEFRDQNTDLRNQNSEIRSKRSQTEMVRADKPRASTRIKLCDDDFLAELQAKEAYQDLNVRNVFSKMVAYCELRGKQPTRGRLLNWLNREDRPMGNGNGNSNTAGYQTAPERRDAAVHRRLQTVAELQSRGNRPAN